MPLSLSKKCSPYDHWECLSEETGDCLKIVPERGGLITSWKCNGREIIYLDQTRFADTSKSIRGGIPILFPICGGLLDNKFIFDNIEYKLEQHGFARDSSWEINLLNDKSGILLKLQETNSSLLAYPFKFDLQIEIKLKSNSLEILSRIKNNSHKIMPFSFGLHPYFSVSDLNQVQITGLKDQCINQKNMEIKKTDQVLKSLSDGIDLISETNNSSQIIDLKDKSYLTMVTKQPFNLTVVWTEPPRKMVCLEPWTSPRNSLNNHQNLIKLNSGKIQELYCKFIFNKFT